MSENQTMQCWVNIFRAIGIKELKIIIDALEVVKEEMKDLLDKNAD